nr:polyketide synthase dehydratase domain-containing protein [Streptomyces gilvosporeus]
MAELAAEHVTRDHPATAMTAWHALDFHRPVTARENGAQSVYRIRDAGSRQAGLETVELIGDVTTPDGRVLQRGVVHARLSVAHQPLIPTPPDVPVAPDHGSGQPGTPVFYHPRCPIHLSGLVASLAELRTWQGGATARFHPEIGTWNGRFAACRLPVLLIDALTQLALLTDGRSAAPDAAPGTARVPTAIDRVELFTPDNDTGLLSRYGGAGITLGARTGHNQAEADAWAAAPDGSVLARVIGVRAAPAVGGTGQ